MRWLLALYLLLYFLLIGGAVLALAAAGALERLPLPWVAGLVAMAVLLGVLLAVVSQVSSQGPPAAPPPPPPPNG